MEMSDKERLENLNPTIVDNQGNVTLKGEDYHWLMEQEERIEELELEKDGWKYTAQSYYMKIQELREQNKRYREALEFYADEETYETKFATDTDEIFDPFTLIELDEGKKARKALEGEE